MEFHTAHTVNILNNTIPLDGIDSPTKRKRQNMKISKYGFAYGIPYGIP
jgi:hypothetical protein